MGKSFLVMLSACLFLSCDVMFNAMVFPNSCQRCDVLDGNNMLLETFQGCGGENTNLEQKAKAYAFDVMDDDQRCDVYVECESWTRVEEE